jgi:hypothetical protein
LVLLAVALWGLRLHRRHTRRNDWTRPLDVALVLVGPSALPPGSDAAWERGTQQLESWLTAELDRARPGAHGEIHLRRYGPTPLQEPLPLAPASDGLWDRTEYGWTLSRRLDRLDSAAGVVARAYDARLYVLLEHREENAPRFAEGIAEAGGEIGLVHAVLEDDDLTLALTATAHELLHCLGASDKYDADGHALPDGLVEPSLAPPFPQRFADPMVGELPLGPHRGRLPRSLDELRMGAQTAREIGFLP